MYYSDYHIHSKFSPDSREDLKNIIITSIEKGLKEIAITDHYEYDVLDDITGSWALDLEPYIAEILRLKEKYKEKINIKLGLEIGMMPHLGDHFREVLKDKPFDFIIASSHSLKRRDIGCGTLFPEHTKDMIQDLYFKTVLENIKAFDGFSVYGHLDFITRYGGPSYKSLDLERNRGIIDEILRELIKKNKGIEINTSGYRYNENRCYPCYDILKRYYDLGGRIVTVGSDAHKHEDIRKDFDKAYKMLKDIGFDSIASFTNQKLEFIKIK